MTMSAPVREYLLDLVMVDEGDNATLDVILEVMTLLLPTPDERLEAADKRIDYHLTHDGCAAGPDACAECDRLWSMRADAH